MQEYIRLRSSYRRGWDSSKDLIRIPTIPDQHASCMAASFFVMAWSIHSFASSAMTKLLSWRNEERLDTRLEKATFGLKCCATELALFAIATVAVVESAVYAIFRCVVRTKSKQEYYAALLQSSSFTILWTAAVGTYYNFTARHIAAHEKDAKLLFIARTQ